MTNLLLRNVRPLADEACDILIENGRIAGFGQFEPVAGMPVEEGGGAIVIPGLIDAHTHLDKTTWGMPWHVNNRAAILRERIDFERENRKEIGIDPHRQSMRHAIGLVAHGSTHIRSHVDIDPTHGLSLVEGIWETREKLRGVIDIEVVAFPQSGLMVMPGTAELLDEALKQGCEVLGGIDPCGIDRDPKGQLDLLFALAVRHGVPIDIHLHEAGELGAFTMELIFERVRANGMEGQVAISHAFALGMNDHLRVGRLIEEIAALDVAIVTTGAPSATVPSIRQLKAAGVRVAAGCDGIRDTWGPWGQPDMMDRARVIGMKNGVRSDIELEHVLHIVSQGGADVMGIEGYGLAEGCAADFTLVAGETLAHAVVETAPRPMVVKGGRVTARDGKALVEMP
ncbi:amidohydrolase family protein [Nitratireductor aquimarinus]|uniref:Amidohydrolase family protein n=1 Tax=Nitratireductor aquimarinus TaxID=889300 RepID=A0ABU4AQ29_9HYPH|nr:MULTISPECIES: amidohydrolase family protein [Nitratireductor]MBN7760675.1 amidohydrolase family protein [Nitratireductor aquibiodomus]MBN7776582.1 amidohydrolase family protein [Nitratireductor pacificus]MBN7779449.1 amidohydrolase family protein [Nitratireductor pacificus]MBN7788256.1 amidohydrolase family protein [Nitratireductor aquimarinus]MBY6098303.1 amidohydrolase family protein [Nitratireductor aquimarinus]